MNETLDEITWKECVKSVPITAIDLVFVRDKSHVLMGQRNNEPAMNSYFVPGGRVYKNERIIDAFNRILLSETGLNFPFNKTTSMGLYEHFYNVTAWSSSECSTHYIIEARLIEIEQENIKLKINLNEQHSDFEWISLEDMKSNSANLSSSANFEGVLAEDIAEEDRLRRKAIDHDEYNKLVFANNRTIFSGMLALLDDK